MSYITAIIFAALSYRWWIFILLAILQFIYLFFYDENKHKAILNLLLFLLFSSYILFRFSAVPSGEVVERGVITNAEIFPHSTRYTLKVNPIKKVLFYSQDDKLEIGSKITIKGDACKFKEASMPLLFNERIYQNSIGINYRVDVKKITVDGLSNRYYFEKFREKIKNIFDDKLSPLAAEISKGVSLKYKERGLIEEKLMYFGLSHILSVSGLHVGIIYLFIFYLVGLLIPFIKFRTGLSLFFIWCYGYMLNFPVSLLRAIIMITVFEYGRIYNPKIDRISILKIAFIVCMLINPLTIFNVGFILSFSSVFSIFFIYPELKKDIPYKSKIIDLLLLNLSIQVVTLPIIIYNFNTVNLLSVVWNVLFIPMFSVYIWLTFGFVFLNKIPVISNILVYMLDRIAYFFDLSLNNLSFKILKLVFESPSIYLIIIYYIALAIFYYRHELQYINIKFSNIFILTMVFLFSANIYMANKKDRIYFMDIGQGDGALISVDGKNYLIDTGGNPFVKGMVGEKILEPFLIKNGFRNIEAVFLSHYDYDHCGALTELTDNINIKYVICDHQNESNIQFPDRINNKLFIVKPGSKFQIGKNYYLNSLKYNKVNGDENNSSMVQMLKKDRINICLFTGDIEEPVESQLKNERIKSLILKVSHHGSKNGSTTEFIRKVAPKYAIISVGKGNSYGHPAKETLKRLKSYGVNIFRTDKDGLISYDLNTNEILSYNKLTKSIDYWYLFMNLIMYFILIVEMRRIHWNTQDLLIK